MESTNGKETLERSVSQLSTASRKSGTVKGRSRNQSLVTPTSAKTLESFPSLSPDASPGVKHATLPSAPLPAPPIGEPPKPVKDEITVQNLLQSTQSFRGRSALFADAPQGGQDGVPGALHHTTDENIRRLLKKTGAVALVRQLSMDVAERDAEMTAFRRRAEEREKELKKMLREVEVSNLDIEKRLHRISHPKEDDPQPFQLPHPTEKKNGGFEADNRTRSVTSGIDEMMGEAMKDNVGALNIDEDYLDSLGDTDRHATLKAKDVHPSEPDGQSIVSSIDSNGKSRGTLRGWKDYLWSGNNTSRKTSKASSVISDYDGETEAVRPHRQSVSTNGRRKVLNDDLFQPLARAATTGDGPRPPESRKSSTSVASWTMKLFAGNPTPSREPDRQGSIRNRSNTTGGDQNRSARNSSTASAPPPRSAKAALMRVSSMESTRQSRKPTLTSLPGQKASAKSAIPPVPPLPASPAPTNTAANLGPVEMDTIHPPDSKPPTLVQNNAKRAQ